MKRELSWLLVPLALTVSACEGPTPPPTVTSVVVTPASVTLVTLGEAVLLTATARDVNGNTIDGKPVAWTSSNPVVATVSSSGLASSVSSGLATITATADGVSGSSLLTVAITSHQTVATGADGMARFAQLNLEIQTVNVVTAEPIEGIQVTLIDDGNDTGLLALDPDGEFAPIIRMTDNESRSSLGFPAIVDRSSTIISILVGMTPRSLQGEIASFTATLNRTLARYGTKLGWFECGGTTLDDAFTTLQFILEVGVYEQLGNITVIAATTAVGSAGLGAPLATAIAGVGIASSVGSLTAVAFNQLIVGYYRALNYAGSDRFEVCHLNHHVVGLFLDGLILIAPLENLDAPAGTASLKGMVRSSTTSAAVPAEVALTGPSPRGVSTSDGSFKFTGLIAGSYVLTAASPGYVPLAVTVPLSVAEAATQDVTLSPGSIPALEAIAGTYTGPVDETSAGLRLIAVYTFDITQAGGTLGGTYSVSGTIGAESVTGTGTLSGTIAVGTNPEVNLTSTSDTCPAFSNQLRGTYDGAQQVITLTGTVHIFRRATCTLIAAYPNTVITFTR